MMWDDVFNSLYEEIMKERTKKDMKLEYKFYEKNLAPKWLEGDYDLHIEGNRMVMTSKQGTEVETRCHPDDDWRLQVGIDELKERMIEKTKPIEPIKLCSKVKFKKGKADWYIPHYMQEWCAKNMISRDYIFKAYETDEIFSEREEKLEDYEFIVLYIGKNYTSNLAYILSTDNKYGLIADVDWLEAVK